MNRYIKAMIKTQVQIAELYPEAEYWGKEPLERGCLRSADEVVLPYLGKTVWLRKIRDGQCSFYYVIQDTEVVILAGWITYFDSEGFVPPADVPYDSSGEIKNDIWIEFYEGRHVVIDELLIITG